MGPTAATLNTAAVALLGTVEPPATWTATCRPAPTREDPPRPVRVSANRLGVIGVNVVADSGGVNPATADTDNLRLLSDP